MVQVVAGVVENLTVRTGGWRSRAADREAGRHARRAALTLLLVQDKRCLAAGDELAGRTWVDALLATGIPGQACENPVGSLVVSHGSTRGSGRLGGAARVVGARVGTHGWATPANVVVASHDRWLHVRTVGCYTVGEGLAGDGGAGGWRGRRRDKLQALVRRRTAVAILQVNEDLGHVASQHGEGAETVAARVTTGVLQVGRDVEEGLHVAKVDAEGTGYVEGRVSPTNFELTLPPV
mmetsp:Transcript_16337/g.51118  ORF Transcript_16337/g.51118 Transcript_16337/m.51118 type:complete len:237 (-) Transcript_16337:286-996(-)